MKVAILILAAVSRVNKVVTTCELCLASGIWPFVLKSHPVNYCLLKQLYIALIFYLRTQQTSHIERCIPPDYLHETENQKERLD